jgi:hypothetical protein
MKLEWCNIHISRSCDLQEKPPSFIEGLYIVNESSLAPRAE